MTTKTTAKTIEDKTIENADAMKITKRGKAKWEVFIGDEIVHTARTKKEAEEFVEKENHAAAVAALEEQKKREWEEINLKADAAKEKQAKPEKKKKDKGGKKETKGNDTDKKGNGTKKTAAPKKAEAVKKESRAYSAGVAIKEFLDNAKEKEAPVDQLVIRANAIYVDRGGADNLRESKFYVPKTIDALRAMGMVEYDHETRTIRKCA
jgi:hypothetical protein